MKDFFLRWLPDGVLLAIGIYVMFYTVTGGFFKKGVQGVVVSVPEACGGCFSQEGTVEVMAPDRQIVTALIDACSLCRQRVKPGDRVRLDVMGGRVVAGVVGFGKGDDRC